MNLITLQKNSFTKIYKDISRKVLKRSSRIYYSEHYKISFDTRMKSFKRKNILASASRCGFFASLWRKTKKVTLWRTFPSSHFWLITFHCAFMLYEEKCGSSTLNSVLMVTFRAPLIALGQMTGKISSSIIFSYNYMVCDISPQKLFLASFSGISEQVLSHTSVWECNHIIISWQRT